MDTTSMKLQDANKEFEDADKLYPPPPPAYPGEVNKKDPMAGLTQKEKDLLAEMKGLEWSEFTQNTTFHGVKYIFEDTPFKLRR